MPTKKKSKKSISKSKKNIQKNSNKNEEEVEKTEETQENINFETGEKINELSTNDNAKSIVFEEVNISK